MAEFTRTNAQALPTSTTSTSNLNATSKITSESYNTSPGPRSATLRPAALKKPRPRRPSFQGDQVTPDMRPVLHLFDIFSRKIYMEGYLCMQDIVNNQGRTSSNDSWIEYYVELCGSILSFWKIVNNHDSEVPEVAQAPFTLNLSNCLVDLSIPQVSQRMHVFFLYSIQGEKFYLQAPDDDSLNLWVSAIRLSCFERSRLQEVYTATLIKRPGLKDFGNGTVLVKGKLEGNLKVQFSGDSEPKNYWVVVADHRAEDKKKKDLSFTRGQALFYENKKGKKQKPFMTLANVLQTYAIYPEDPALIDKTATFCVEGTLFPTKPTENKPGDFVILTTDSLNEMTKWLFGFFDSFKLYGRPKELLYDFKNPVSPFFAVPTGRSNTKLFLDLHEVEHVEMRESLADVKAAFAEILRQSYNLQQQLPDNSQQPLLNINQKFSRKLSEQSLPQIVTDGLSDNYDRQRTFSNESNSSTQSSNSPTTLKPNSMVSLTGGSQKGSIPTTPVSPHSPLTTNTDRLNSSSQVTQSNKRRGKGAKQLASSDESEDQQGDSQSESEKSDDDDDDDENDDPTLLKNTQENAKVVAEIESELVKVKTDGPVSIGTNIGTFGDSDFMSEVMTAVAEHKDESIQEDNTTKKSKPKRSVSFKNQTAKQKDKSKRRLAPLPSDSEDSGNSDDESKSDENNSEEDSSEDSSLNKNVKSSQIINKPGKGNKKKTRVVPQPSDSSESEGEEVESSDDNEELNDDGKNKMGTQLQQKPYRQPSPYGQYGPGSKHSRSGINSTNLYVDKNYPQIHNQGNFENDIEGIVPLRRNPMRSHNILSGGNVTDEQLHERSKGKKSITSEETDSEQEDDEIIKDITTKSNNKEFYSQQDDYQFEIGGLDIDINALNFDTMNEPTNNTMETNNSDNEVLNRTTKVFKPTKQKDKLKNTAGHIKSKSSDISSSDESENKSSTSDEEEPLAALVEEGGGLNPNFVRPNFGTPPRSVSPNYPPRSVSPNYPPNQRWGPGSDYVDNMYLPIDNRRSVMMPPHIRGGEYYDEDYMKAGGRPRSMMNPGQMMAGRRRVSGGQLDYARDSLYLDDGYYDDRPSHFRPVSLIEIPQSQLSARQQEMLAKETGAPLINLPERQKDPQTGLVGAITARENQRKALLSSTRHAELERERAFERERERRLMEQRQQAMMAEREREFLHRQSHFGPPMGDSRSSRFLGGQQYLDPMPGHRGSYYESYGSYIQTEDDYDEDDDVPLAVGSSIPSTIPPVQTRQPRPAKNRRRDTE